MKPPTSEPSAAGETAAQAVHDLHHALVGAVLDGHPGEEVGERAAAHRGEGDDERREPVEAGGGLPEIARHRRDAPAERPQDPGGADRGILDERLLVDGGRSGTGRHDHQREDQAARPGGHGGREPEGERAEDAGTAHVSGHVEPARLALVVGVGGHGDEGVERPDVVAAAAWSAVTSNGEQPEVARRIGHQRRGGEERGGHAHHGQVPVLPLPHHVDERDPEDLEGVGHEPHRRHRRDLRERDPGRREAVRDRDHEEADGGPEGKLEEQEEPGARPALLLDLDVLGHRRSVAPGQPGTDRRARSAPRASTSWASRSSVWEMAWRAAGTVVRREEGAGLLELRRAW